MTNILKRKNHNPIEFEYVMDLAKTAGLYIKKLAGKAEQIAEGVGEKERADITTKADVLSLSCITNGLLDKFPDHGILAEGLDKEEVKKLIYKDIPNLDGNKVRSKNGLYWVIDPLCGTIMHKNGIPDYIVSIALVEEDTNILFGCVYQPDNGNMHHAIEGRGAFLTDQGGRGYINVSRHDDLKGSVVSIEHGICRQEDYILHPILNAISRQRTAGTCGLELALIGSGNMHGLMKRKQPIYDYAAGLLILYEAGGMATDLDGNEISKELSYKRHTDLLCSNRAIHDKLLQYTRTFNLETVLNK